MLSHLIELNLGEKNLSTVCNKAEHAVQSYAAGIGGQGAHAMIMLRICNACLELQSQLD